VFTKGRDFSAWLGLVPKQISTGDRTIPEQPARGLTANQIECALISMMAGSS
jgi:hypothetical protein